MPAYVPSELTTQILVIAGGIVFVGIILLILGFMLRLIYIFVAIATADQGAAPIVGSVVLILVCLGLLAGLWVWLDPGLRDWIQTAVPKQTATPLVYGPPHEEGWRSVTIGGQTMRFRIKAPSNGPEAEGGNGSNSPQGCSLSDRSHHHMRRSDPSGRLYTLCANGTRKTATLSVKGGITVERHPYARDEKLKVISVEPPYVVVEGMNGAHYRAKYIPSHESLRAEPLHPRDILTVNAIDPGLAIVERVTQGQRDGCQYEHLEFQLISQRV